MPFGVRGFTGQSGYHHSPNKYTCPRLPPLSLPPTGFQGVPQNLYPGNEEKVSGHHGKIPFIKIRLHNSLDCLRGGSQRYSKTGGIPVSSAYQPGSWFQTKYLFNFTNPAVVLKPRIFLLLTTYACVQLERTFQLPLQLLCQPLFSLLPGATSSSTSPSRAQSCFTHCLLLLHTLPLV